MVEPHFLSVKAKMMIVSTVSFFVLCLKYLNALYIYISCKRKDWFCKGKQHMRWSSKLLLTKFEFCKHLHMSEMGAQQMWKEGLRPKCCGSLDSFGSRSFCHRFLKSVLAAAREDKGSVACLSQSAWHCMGKDFCSPDNFELESGWQPELGSVSSLSHSLFPIIVSLRERGPKFSLGDLGVLLFSTVFFCGALNFLLPRSMLV